MSALVKILTQVLGVVLLLFGLAGFFVDGTLLVFEVDTLQNVFHLLSGIVALGAARVYAYARLYLIVFGLIYAAVAGVGFMMDGDILGLFHVNMEDNLLHTAIAVVCLLFGFGSKKAT